jgi:DnaJ-class molecular chaperone
MTGHTLRLPREDLAALRGLSPELDRPHNRQVEPEEIVPTDPEERIHYDFLKKMGIDHYAFLGVAKSAAREEISSAYDLLAPAYRLGPKRKDFAPDTKDQAKQLLGRLFQAYEALSDEQRREAYDQSLLKVQTQGSGAQGDGEVLPESGEPNAGPADLSFSD